MATVLTPAEQRVVLSGITWGTYERLLAEHGDRSGTRFTYDAGELEIVVGSFEHEEINRITADVFAAIADELGVDFVNAGSTTLKREDLNRGLEPDTCFYVGRASHVRGRERIELPSDPAPDLVVATDMTNPSLDKMAIYSAMGVREVWRYVREGFRIFALEGDAYEPRSESSILPGLTAVLVSKAIHEARTEPRQVWLGRLREWARGFR